MAESGWFVNEGRFEWAKRRVFIRPVAVVTLGCMFASCAPMPRQLAQVREHEAQAAKTGSGELRQDTAPLTKRFPLLSNLVLATWMSGTLGKADVPGPSTYWIDAVVKLRPADAQALRSAAEVQPVEVIAGLSEPLRAVIPDGAVFGSPELDAKFSTDGYSSRVYLIDGADSLVLMTVFQ